MKMRQRFTAVLGMLIVLGLVVIPATAEVSPHHTWGNYHWEANQIKIGNNLSPMWQGHLSTTRGEWNAGGIITLLDPILGSTTRSKTCKPIVGRIEVCNYTYGRNKWLGITQIWTNGDHITQATSKLNDSYYADPRSGYNTPAEQLSVICHELAHGFGLDHWDEDHDNVNTGSCMDYSNYAAGGVYAGDGFNYGPSDEHPHSLDFQDLNYLYNTHHAAEQSTTGAASTGAAAAAQAETGDDPSEWGEVIERDDKGRPHLYRKNLGKGQKLFTFVTHVDESRGRQADAVRANDVTADTSVSEDGKKDESKHGKDKQRKSKRDKRRR